MKATPTSAILSRQVVATDPETTDGLGLPVGASVLEMRRLRSIAGEPCLLEQLWLPLPAFDALKDSDRVVGRPTCSAGCTPTNPSSVRSSSSTKASTARTGLSSVIQSSSCSGNSTLCVRCSPSMNRLIQNSGRSTCRL